ncbi:MAG TPA: copper-binding protein [Hyphomonadaceae bacterium]|nr:copper-binding protein [Hyphomonadaceae bacterium]
MKGKLIALAISGALAVAIAACSQETTTLAAKEDMGSMAEPAAPAAAAGSIRAAATVTAVDATAGTISLDHGAIPAISWPAMSMQFRVEDPAILLGIAVGDRVAVELKSAEEPEIVTMVQKQ